MEQFNQQPSIFPRVGHMAARRKQRLTEMLLDPVEDVHAHPAVHHVDGQTPLAEATRAADPVQVRLVVRVAVLVNWQVKVDHHRHLLHIDTCT